MSVQYTYGTFDYDAETKSSDMLEAFRDESLSLSPAKIAMRPLADDRPSVQNAIDSEQNSDAAQAGVKRQEAISSTWSRTSLLFAYLGFALLAFATSLEQQTTNNLTIFATSAFSSHSLVATVGVVQAVVLSVAKPPMSKIADVLGRLEAFSLSIFIYVLGYVQQATSRSVQTYAAAQIFYATGSTGLQVLIQIFVADTSDLLNRALCSTLPQLPFLLTVWLGPNLAQTMLNRLNWRWGYGIWTIILPVSFVPLACALALNQRKAAKRGLLPPSQFSDKSGREIVRTLWYELDVFGLLLLCCAVSLILIPLTLDSRSGWNNDGILAMLFTGLVCLIAFPFWERSKTLAPRAFFPPALIQARNVIAGMTLAFFYFAAFYLSIYPYFQSYLLVVHDLSVTTAGIMVQTFTFSATVAAFLVSFLIRHWKRYKPILVLGSIIYVAGLGLMLGYRTEQASIPTILLTQMIVGIGGGMLNVSAQLGVQACASHQDVASATAVFLTMLEMGGAAGNAISGVIWSNSVPTKLALYLPTDTKAQAAAIYGNVSLAANGWPMGSPTRIAISRAYQETMTRILSVAVCVAAPCIVLSLVMKNYKLDEMDQQAKGVVIGVAKGGRHQQHSLSASAADSSVRRRSAVDVDDNEVDGTDNEETRGLLQDSYDRL